MKELSYNIIGLMSGTSMDGLDLSYANYFKTEKGWDFKLIATQSCEYPDSIFQALKNATKLPAIELFELDHQLGIYFAEQVNDFVQHNSIDKSEVDCIASHGHTIFHQPQKGFTVQIGCGTTLAYHTQINVINDFRKKDVIAGGQGAPLVPIGDFGLAQFRADSFLNIGGFANMSFRENKKIRAFDICPANILINWYMRNLGHSFDSEGKIARSYPIEKGLLDELNSISIYSESQPTSLGIEWLMQNVIPITDEYECSNESKVATITEHIAQQISNRLNQFKIKSVYVTGGGTKNQFLIERLMKLYSGKTIIPDERIIDFKEAIIFGFLGVLFLENEVNCLSSVTGAAADMTGGTLHKYN